MQHIPYADFDYCEFAEWGYKKPTRIWGSPQIWDVRSVLCVGKCKNMAIPVEGQRPRHKQWLGAYGPQPSTTMKYRIPEKLVEYLLDRLKINDIVGSKRSPNVPSHPEKSAAIQVVTRQAEYLPPSDSEAESETEGVARPPLHPSRSTLGRRRAQQTENPPDLAAEIPAETPAEISSEITGGVKEEENE
jgi:hypothetical protein